MDRIAKANDEQWHEHILRMDNDDAFDFKVVERRKRGRPTIARRRWVVKQVEEIGIKKENDIADRSDATLLINFRGS